MRLIVIKFIDEEDEKEDYMITNNAPLRNQSMKKVGEVNLRAAATIEKSHSMKWMRQHKKAKRA